MFEPYTLTIEQSYWTFFKQCLLLRFLVSEGLSHNFVVVWGNGTIWTALQSWTGEPWVRWVDLWAFASRHQSWFVKD